VASRLATRRAGRRSYAAAALLVVLPLGGCADDTDERPEDTDVSEPAAPEVIAPKPDADAQLTVVVGPSTIEVRWRLANTGGSPLLVVDKVPVPSGAGTDWRADAAYVTGEGDDVLLSQQVFAWPDTDMTWEVAPRVGVTELAAGESLEHEVVVPLPLERMHPFGADLGDGVVSLPSDPGTVRFCLGVIAPPYPQALARKQQDGVDTVSHGNAVSDSQYLFCSEPVEL